MSLLRPNPAALASGNVRGWHVVVLFGLAFVLSFACAHLASREVDPIVRPGLRSYLFGLFAFLFFVFVTACVPELRRLFISSLRHGRVASPGDVLISVAALLTWGLGASRMLFNYPVVLLDTDSGFRLLGLGHTPEPGPIFMLLATVSMVVLAPITEEVVFRAYLLNLWIARHRQWVAIIGSSLVFGIWHFQNAPFAAGGGVLFALIYLKYRSLILCIVLHALYNTVMNRLLLGQFFMEKDLSTVTALSSWSLELILAIAFVPLMWLFWKRFRPQSTLSS